MLGDLNCGIQGEFSSPMEKESHVKQKASSLERTSDLSSMLKGKNGSKKQIKNDKETITQLPDRRQREFLLGTKR
jgi:predicted helicase